MKKKALIACLVACGMVMTGCSNGGVKNESETTAKEEAVTEAVENVSEKIEEVTEAMSEVFTTSDSEEGTEGVEEVSLDVFETEAEEESTEADFEIIEDTTEGFYSVDETESEDEEEMKILVAYYSATGTTQKVAETLADYMEADIYSILPEEVYTEEDLDYNNENSRVSKEHEEGTKVKLVEPTIENFEDYDAVFLGYPIWWGEASWVMDEFIESNDFTDKIVIPFCTSASSDIEDSADRLMILADEGEWLQGRRFSGEESEDEIVDWAFDTLYDYLYGDLGDLDLVFETESELLAS